MCLHGAIRKIISIYHSRASERAPAAAGDYQIAGIKRGGNGIKPRASTECKHRLAILHGVGI